MELQGIHTLYLCYFGLREPLVQTQVLPYLRELVAGGMRVSLLTFEPEMEERWSTESVASMRAQLQAEGISWHSLPYHKSPSLPATLYDIWAGARLASELARREQVQILHARAHIAATMGALAKWRLGRQKIKLIFDIRGFMPEEYTDAGVWPEQGWLYKGVKAVERRLLKSSDAFIVLTRRASEILFPASIGTGEKEDEGRPIEVIPCCVDAHRFRAAEALNRDELRSSLKMTDRSVLVYVGSLDGWYLTEEMLDFCAQAHARDPRTFTLLVTQRDVEQARQRLLAKGISAQDFLVTSATPAEVPRYLRAADIALSFIKPCYSKQASSPTKVAEYLAAGLPVVSNAGIGDLDELITGENVGIILRDFSPSAYEHGLAELETLSAETAMRARCQAVAHAQFDLHEVGGQRYRRLYKRLLSPQDSFFAELESPEPSVNLSYFSEGKR